MIYVADLFVNFDDISMISKVNCDFIYFETKHFFEILLLLPVLSFGSIHFMNDLLNKNYKKVNKFQISKNVKDMN